MRLLPIGVASVLSLSVVAPPVGQQPLTVDTAGTGVLLDEGMNRSEAMRNLAYLTDVIGPRLTGSAATRAANDLPARRFQEYGLSAHLDSGISAVPRHGAWHRRARCLRAPTTSSRRVGPGAPGRSKPVRGPVVGIDVSRPEATITRTTPNPTPLTKRSTGICGRRPRSWRSARSSSPISMA
jgi:hypothetical protein